MKKLLILTLISGALLLLSCQKEEELCWHCTRGYEAPRTYCGTVEKMLMFEKDGYTCYLIGP